MEDQVWTYLVIGFLCLIVLIQWYTNKWALEERDWLKRKVVKLMPGNPITRDARLTEEYANRNRRK